VWDVAYSPVERNMLASVGQDGRLLVWDDRTTTPSASVDQAPPSTLNPNPQNPKAPLYPSTRPPLLYANFLPMGEMLGRKCWVWVECELARSGSGPLRAVHVSRHKWPGGLVNDG